MSMIAAIHAKIAEAEKVLDNADMRCNEVEYTYVEANRDAETQREEAWQVLHELKNELKRAMDLDTALLKLRDPIGTKYKWTHKGNPETYRVAIQTKDGILQVKAVTEGIIHFHNECNCVPCWEFENNAPWRKRKPLETTFFKDLAEWDATLPMNKGKLVITSPPITDKTLQALIMKPLKATWESGQLEELQTRFPEGVFVLSSPRTGNQIEIKAHGMAIYCTSPNIVCCTFKQFFNDTDVHLMVKWRGHYIDLSHLL